MVKELIIEPLGMANTGITMTTGMRSNAAVGHDAFGNPTPYWDLPTLARAGALRSNVEDMLVFLEPNIGEPTSPLEQAMRLSHRVRVAVGGEMSVALKWHVLNLGGESIVWHNGGTAGFRTWAGFDPVRKVGAVVLTNSGGSGADDIGFHLVNPSAPLAD